MDQVNGNNPAPASDDPYDRAMNTEYRPPELTVFGHCLTKVEDVVVVNPAQAAQYGHPKAGRYPFVEGHHPADMKRTGISISIAPLPGSPNQYPTDRDMLAESKEWGTIVKPALLVLGQNLKTIHEKYVQARMVPSGRTWQRTRDPGTGASPTQETVVGTVPVLLAVFDTEDECRKAADEFFAGRGGGQSNGAASNGAAPNAAAASNKATAIAFLVPLWQMVKGDKDAMAAQLASNPLTKQHFTIDSPEVVEAMKTAIT